MHLLQNMRSRNSPASGYSTDTFRSELAIVLANAKLPTERRYSPRIEPMPVYIENDTPPLSYSADISDVFLVSFVSMMEHGCQFRDRRVYRKGEVVVAALSSFHFPDSMPYNVYAVVYLFSRYFTPLTYRPTRPPRRWQPTDFSFPLAA